MVTKVICELKSISSRVKIFPETGHWSLVAGKDQIECLEKDEQSGKQLHLLMSSVEI